MKRFFTFFFALVATTAIWAEDFEVDGIYYNILYGSKVAVTYQGDDFYSYSNEYSGSVTIPETVTYSGTTYSVTSIGDGAFWDCESLTSITIPNSVTSIGNYAFYYCSGLTSVTIPNSVTSIGDYAFSGCSGLTSLTIPNSVTSIGECAFYECSLTSIVVEEGNTMYDSRENCNAIIETATNTLITGCQNTIIPNSVTSIGDYAFRYCYGLTSVTIPNSVTSIGDYAFHYCYGLTSVTIPNSVTSIGECAFYECKRLISITIPNSVTSIGGCAFYFCDNLTSITIPNSVTSIGDYAFHHCSSLTSVTIGNSVTSIGDYTFRYCSGLTSITIPNSVTSIGDEAFRGCSSLAVVNVEATTPPTLGTNAFTSSPTCNIPCGTLEVYQASDWKNFVGEFVEQCSDDSGDDGDMDKDLTIVFCDHDNNQISAQTVTLRVPMAPQIAGFTFLYWQTITARVDDVITLQAVYESNTPTAAPEVYVNPANPAQKLIRNGQVYILHEEKMYTISGQVVK